MELAVKLCSQHKSYHGSMSVSFYFSSDEKSIIMIFFKWFWKFWEQNSSKCESKF